MAVVGTYDVGYITLNFVR